jgi:hypothetical protein
MKLSLPRLDKETVTDWLLRHGEKIGAVLAAVAVVWLIWNGIDALRSRSVRRGELPEAIQAAIDRAETHIRSVPRPPADLLPEQPSPLAAIVGWLDTKPRAAPTNLLLDKPLFPEFSRRSQPDVLAIQDLHAVAGIAVLPPKEAPAQAGPQQPAPGRQAGRIVPYVVVTGLIPAARQRDEYRRRFAAAGYQDARRDTPLWSDFEIERCLVVNGKDGPWQKIDLAGVARGQAEWGGGEPLPAPAELLMREQEGRRSRETPLDFCAPLPRRIDRPWGAEPLHPWVIEFIRNRPPPPAPGAADPAAGPREPDRPVFDETGATTAPQTAPETPAKGAVEPPLPEYRLLCFVDTTVSPNTAYRYRARLKVWNPNMNLPRQHLDDPAFATEQRLPSAPSPPSATASVPDPTKLLVDVIPPADLKKLRIRPGTLEVLVLGASEETGNYALRSVLTDVGGLANVEKKFNRTGETRARGEDIVTDRLLVDATGPQADGDDKPRRGPRAIPEPFMAIFLRPDGRFERVTAADSERLIDRYLATLPERESSRREARPAGAGGDSQGFPGAARPQPDNPFQFPPRR